MNHEILVKRLRECQEYFDRSTRNLVEEDSGFVPAEGMYSIAAQVAHVAQTVNWMMDGGFGNGWTMDFAEHDAQARAVVSLNQSRELLKQAFDRAESIFRSQSETELEDRFPDDDPILPGLPRFAVLGGIEDHTAHHRGALTVYARLIGKVSPMPYMEM